MNDPNAPTDDLLEDLEAEFWAMDTIKVINYAMTASAVFEASLTGMAAALLEMPRESSGSGSHIRDRLLEVLRKYVAPQWAAEEQEKRVEATEEMVAGWAEEAA
jgi:hypothetical protein